jgi:formyltetrahydrofolate deformylase
VTSDTIATLLVSCPDKKGIVAALAQLLYGHGANILDADQHTDSDAGQFFQRIRFDIKEAHTDRITIETAIREVAERFEMKWQLRYTSRPKRVALFVSKYDHCFYDLSWRHQGGELACEIPLVVSNHPDLGEAARRFGSEFHHIPVTKETKAEQEKKQVELLEEFKIDLVVLARYMQILSGDFLRSFSGQVINIHHSFLPAFVGSKPYHQAKQRGEKLIGATAHFATPDLDQGPIIDQDVVRVSHRDDIPDQIRKGRDWEKVVLARAVRAHLDDRVLIYDNKTVVFE